MLHIAPPIRNDNMGLGHFGAPRTGKDGHRGIDFACYPHSLILSVSHGIVTKFGKPYYYANPTDKQKIKNKLQYIQVTTEEDLNFRYFYVRPHGNLAIGDKVVVGDILGESQDLTEVWPTMINHCHFEVMLGTEYLDPDQFLHRREV